MAWIANGGYETLGGWSWSFGAARTTEKAATGFYSSRLGFVSPFTVQSITQTTSAPLDAGVRYLLSFYCRARTGGGVLRVKVSQAGAPIRYVDVDKIGSAKVYSGAGVLLEVYSINPIARFARGRLEFVATADAPVEVVLEGRQAGSDGDWFVDDIALEVYSMAVTNQIRDAIVEDLKTVDGLETSTHERPLVENKTSFPAVYFRQLSGQYDADATINTQQQGTYVAIFGLRLLVQSATPLDDLSNLLDAIRNAIDPPTSNVNLLRYDAGKACSVQSAKVVEWFDSEIAPEDSENRRGELSITVSVVYSFYYGDA